MDFKCDELILGKTDADSRALTFVRMYGVVQSINTDASALTSAYPS